MCPGSSLIRNDEPEEGGDAWNPPADKGGGTQFSGVPGVVRWIPGPEGSVLTELPHSMSSWQPICALRERRLGSFLPGSLLQQFQALNPEA